MGTDVYTKVTNQIVSETYIESWIKVLKNEKRAVFSAASHAQRGADFLVYMLPPLSRRSVWADNFAR
jgi:antirestriction protein ArdC